MNANMNEKRGQVRLLAVVAVLAMIVCCFTMFVPASDAETVNLPASGDDGVITIDTDGTYALTEDITGRIVVNEGVTATIDLAGHKISYNNTATGTMEDNSNIDGAVILVKGTLTINDSSEEMTGSVVQEGVSAAAAVHVSVGGKLIINGGNFQITDETTSSYYVLKNLGTVTINGGVFESNSGKDSGTSGSSTIANGWWDGTNNAEGADAVMNIYGGTFNGNHYIKNDDYGVMNIYGGTFSGTARGAAIMNVNELVIDDDADDTQSLVINGGTENSAVLNWAIPGNEFDCGKLTIKSGTFNVDTLIGISSNSDPFGDVTVASGLKADIISASGLTMTGTVTVNGKTLTYENYTVEDGGSLTITEDGTVNGEGLKTFPEMPDKTIFVNNGTEYIVFTYVNKVTKTEYQYGLTINDITYDTTPIMDSELSVNPIALPTADGGTLEFSNTDSKWYDEVNGVYEGALKGTTTDGNAAPSAGLYNGCVRFSASITGSFGDDKEFVNNTLTQYLDLTVLPGTVDSEVAIEGWIEGQYDESVNAPIVTVDPEVGFSATFEYFTDEGCSQSAGTDPSVLKAGDYWVKATIELENKDLTTESPVAKFTVGIDELGSQIIFHPLQDLKDDTKEGSILGMNPDVIQNIAFNTDDGLNYTVNGTVYKFAYKTDAGIVGLDALALGANTEGYFIAFYVEGVGFDVTSIPADGKDITDYINLTLTGAGADDNKCVEITPEENDTQYRFYVMYLNDIGADNENAPEPAAGQDGFDYDVDFDGADGEKYVESNYTVDLSYLNYYLIILHDDKEPEDNYYNDLLKYYRADGSQFVLPSGAGDAFAYWTTEAGSTNDRVFEFGSIMLVGAQYDPDSDGVINLQAYYGESTPVQPGTVSEDIAISMYYQQGSRLVVSITAVDGGYIPAGNITISGFYMQEVTLPVVGTTYTSTQIPDTIIAVEEGQTSVVLTIDDYDWLGSVISLDATFEVDGNAVSESNTMTFTFVAPTTEA